MPEFAELVDGYKRFRSGAYAVHKSRFDMLSSEGQSPPLMVISCSDSRVDPATIFDTVPGQVFALRNVANLVPPFETGGGLHGVSAAIEFGVLGLKVRHIVILGHAQCGGIKAALEGIDLGQPGKSFVASWVDILADARDRVVAQGHDNPLPILEQEAIKVSLANLRTFPWVVERENAGELKLHGAIFAIADGELSVLDEATGIFSPV